MFREPQKTTPSAASARRIPKVGDTVTLVGHHQDNARFAIGHAEATIEKVHFGGKFIDLIVVDEDPSKTLRITRSPRDDSSKTPDSWHFPEPVDQSAK